MREVRLAVDQVEVRRARSKIWAGVFGGATKPTMVGRFEVRSRLGAGGMGIVYEAYDPQLDRRVALKVMRADATLAAEGAARLMDEARAMAKLSHPNVLTVYEVGTVEDQVFIAMALVEGYTLRSWLDSEARSTGEVMSVLRDAGQGLAAAHAVGLVHRDFKPENVLVSADGHVFVTDFGLARSFAASESGGWTNLSFGRQTTRMAGTPAYMAPEQLRGGTAEARSDQFAWCVATYEALVGRRPYGDDELQRLALDPAYVPEPITLPIGVSVSRRVRAALERGLSLDVDARFASLAQLLDAVRPPRRRWVPVSLGAMVATVGLGVALVPEHDPCPARPEQWSGVWGAQTQTSARDAFLASKMPYAHRAWTSVEARADAFVARWVALDQRACREENVVATQCLQRRRAAFGAVSRLFRTADAGVVEHAVSMVSALPPLADCSDPDAAARVAEPDAASQARTQVDDVRALFLAARYEEARGLAAEVRTALPLGDPLWLEVAALEGRVALAEGDADGSTEAFERVLEHASGARGQLPTAEAAVGLVEVQARLTKTDFDAAAVLVRAAKISVASAGNPPRLRTRLESARAGLEIAQGNFDQGIALVEGARGVLAELGDETRLEQAELMGLAAKALFRKQRFEDASRLGDASLAILRDTLGPEHPAVGQALLLPGSIALVQSDIETAEATYQRAADILAKTVGRSHSSYATALVSLANAARARGDYPRARMLTAEALEGMLANFPEDNMRVMAVRGNLASLDHQLGNLEAARERYIETLGLQRASLGAHHELSVTLANIGRVESELGNHDAAQEAVRETLKIRTAVFGETHDRTLATRLLLADIELAAGGDPADILAELEEVLGLREAVLGASHPFVAETIVLQAKAAFKAGRSREALEFAEDALRRRTKTQRPPGEIDTCLVLVAQAALAAGDIRRAREAAAAPTWRGPKGSELRGWCDDCKADMQAIAAHR
ncbi:MAG: tetratricopeptide repeat protein [Nannocystaceae bacterium]|nr:tetratricopeptide repeat protein [Nannocystaceae bacterium]